MTSTDKNAYIIIKLTSGKGIRGNKGFTSRDYSLFSSKLNQAEVFIYSSLNPNQRKEEIYRQMQLDLIILKKTFLRRT